MFNIVCLALVRFLIYSSQRDTNECNVCQLQNESICQGVFIRNVMLNLPFLRPSSPCRDAPYYSSPYQLNNSVTNQVTLPPP